MCFSFNWLKKLVNPVKSNQFKLQCQCVRSEIISKCHNISTNNLAIKKKWTTDPHNLSESQWHFVSERNQFQKVPSAWFYLLLSGEKMYSDLKNRSMVARGWDTRRVWLFRDSIRRFMKTNCSISWTALVVTWILHVLSGCMNQYMC